MVWSLKPEYLSLKSILSKSTSSGIVGYLATQYKKSTLPFDLIYVGSGAVGLASFHIPKETIISFPVSPTASNKSCCPIHLLAILYLFIPNFSAHSTPCRLKTDDINSIPTLLQWSLNISALS